jgi:leader peptidase (prepilin peptidase) / N-methyltransferase
MVFSSHETVGLITALGILFNATVSGASSWGNFTAGMVLATFLLLLGAFDFLQYRLPDVLCLPLIAAGISTTWWLDLATPGWRAASAIIGYFVLTACAHIYWKIRGRHGLGRGDAKLFSASGAWVGAEALPLVLLCASLAGLATVGAMHACGRKVSSTTRIPFGSFLALGTWFVWLFGRT